jgi:hypothetical protein
MARNPSLARSLTLRLIPVLMLAGGLAWSTAKARSVVPTTLRDFHVPGTQTSDLTPSNFFDSNNCKVCHGTYDTANSPYDTWKGSLMGVAALDPLFQAQVTLAEQDAPGVGYYCMRCHAPTSVISGNAFAGSVDALEGHDLDGVNCNFCHSMVDPVYKPGISPPQDEAILAALDEVPAHYGNAMFVLDPTGTRRGPRPDAAIAHDVIHSSFMKESAMCGTCHDVGNVAITRQPDGTYFYNAVDEPSPDHNPHNQFPLERTFSEWSLSDFARGGVDMGGRFGGDGATVVATCQDSHMPKTTARASVIGEVREGMARHEFAGATAWVLEITALHYADDPAVDKPALERGRAAAINMVQRAASLEMHHEDGAVRVRVINQTGHKFPTGHIEGRRAWLNVRYYDDQGTLLAEHGAYDLDEARLVNPAGTRVYEMFVGLSQAASDLTGLPAGITGHMSLANTIEKDTRIPPRGFNQEAFAAAGAPAVNAPYQDGQHWDEVAYPIPPGAIRCEARVYYQTVTREYIEELRDHNHTNDSGAILHDLWERTNRHPPIEVSGALMMLGNFNQSGWTLH